MRLALLLILSSIICFAQCTPNSAGICISGLTPVQDNLLGPLTPYGSNPWTFGDLAEKGIIDYMAPQALASPPALGTILPGTFSYAGTGTDTIQTTSNLQATLAGVGEIVLTWDTIDGAKTGRMLVPISSVTPTTIIASEHFKQPAFGGVSGYLLPGPDSNGCTAACWTVENPTQSWNYYDDAIGFYRFWIRSALTVYQTYARQYADIQWQWVLDHGYRPLSPRAGSLVSQFFRATDGHPERLPYLYNWIGIIVPLWATNADLREAGYTLWDVALGAKVDTNPTRHSQYCSWLTTYTPHWTTIQNPDGSWSENEFALNSSFVSAPLAFTSNPQYVTAPWRIAINIRALEAANESLNDTSTQGSNNPGLASTVLNTITKAVVWQNNYGLGTNRGVFYEVNSQSNDQATVSGPGTVDLINGSTVVVGHGTNFLTHCTANPFVGLMATRTIYKFASCPTDTSAVLTVAYGLYGEVGNLLGSAVAYAPPASSSCGASLAQYCYTGTGDRNLNRTSCSGIAWLYNQTLNTQYKTWADECYSESLGGPTSGLTSSSNMGSITLPCSGPGCDGLVTDVVAGARNCGTPGAPTACVFGTQFGNLGKNYGECFGAPGCSNELAWRLTTPPPTATCDVNHDGFINVLDIQLQINQTLGITPCTNDLDGSGTCTVADVQRIINATLGAACHIGA